MQTKSSLRNFSSAQKRREFLEKELNIKLDNISHFSFPEDTAIGRNIENLIGATQIPLGIAGPLRINFKNVIPSPALAGRGNLYVSEGKESSAYLKKIATSPSAPRNDKENKDYYIPLATTEGALVASVSRGCKAVTEAGGAKVAVESAGITRGPVFKTAGIHESLVLESWITKNFNQLKKIAEKTSSHLKLLKYGFAKVGKNLFVRFYFDTQDAMGMNMATFATQEIVRLIEQKTKAKCISLAGNFDIDKKPAWLNFALGRGKRVWAEATLSRQIVTDILKTTPETIVEVVERKCHLGSMMAGSLGYNGHFANVVAAIFAATGQDLGHVTEGSLGVTSAEILETGDLYFSIYLPALIVGTVGGGTHLPTQQEAFKIMSVGSVLEYAKAVGAAILAGELSLIASLAEGSLATAHKKLGRKGKN